MNKSDTYRQPQSQLSPNEGPNTKKKILRKRIRIKNNERKTNKNMRKINRIKVVTDINSDNTQIISFAKDHKRCQSQRFGAHHSIQRHLTSCCARCPMNTTGCYEINFQTGNDVRPVSILNCDWRLLGLKQYVFKNTMSSSNWQTLCS